MRRFLVSAAALLLFFTGPSVEAQLYQGRELVKADLLADTTAIVPGKSFTAGVRLRMAPGWHTYWKFSGDAGLPTEIKWKLPPGWKVGEIQWPLPHKMMDPGDIQTYGYSDEVVLLQEITPPASVTGPNLKLEAETNWLVCERLCIPGSATLALSLPTSKEASAANADVFDKFRKMLPKSWPSSEAASAVWSRTGSEFQLKVKSAVVAGAKDVDFFPSPGNKIVISHPAAEKPGGDEVLFRIPIESAPPDEKSIAGLLVFETADGGRTGWSIESAAAAPAVANSPATAAVPPRGLLTFLFFGFVGGFILNLMPCVLPVISLKIFGFVRQAGQSRRKIFRSGLAFTAGIFAWFIGLALVLIALKSANHQITWAGQFTNPYFVLGMSVLVLVFALNLFGVFEITLPQSATRGMMKLGESEGEAASFFQGVFATILATPCTAPFLGTALGFAFTQSGSVILAMFVAIAAGMALPYLLLCAQPAWLRFLPKPGPWMVHVKQFMGFLLLATLVFLLYVLGAQRGLEAAVWAASFLLIISILCWMKGAFLTPVAATGARVATWLVMLLLLAGGGWYFIGEKFRSSKLVVSTDAGDGWQRFTPERLESELSQGRLVFVDFTAAWCITCKFNERSVLESDAVREAFQRHSVVKIKADWTNGDPEITKLLQQFGRPGVPLYVLYRGKSEEPIVFPELLTKSIVLEKLETASRTVAAH